MDEAGKAPLPRNGESPSEPGSPLSGGGPARSGLSVLALILAGLGLAAGLSGLGAAFWLYGQGQAETRRIASEIAQLRLSLELHARGAGPTSEELADLAERLDALEAQRAAPLLPPIGPTAAPAAAANAGSDGDCLPPGMRILVAQGDSYPVCGQAFSVEVGQVANGYIMLEDGTTIASGGSMLLAGTPCSLGVTSGGDEGLTGYAEIRVTC